MINFEELKKLYRDGWALHWLRPKSKVPLQSGWTSGPRAKWETLEKTFKENLNVGVRLGEASKLKDGFLAVIDVDIKSPNPKHRKEAFKALKNFFPDYKKAPLVWSGRGNGSAHYYVKVSTPLRGDETKARSKEMVRVKIPSSQPSVKEREKLNEGELKAGVRIRSAWEISLLSEGRQVVLPPSLHPDTGNAYKWERPPGIGIPLLRAAQTKGTALRGPEKEPPQAYVWEDVNPRKLGLREDQVLAITEGKDVEDRSAECFSICLALLGRGVKENTIVSLLTDPKNFLGQTGYDHAKTRKRSRAAKWIERYCIRKAKAKVEESAFDIEVTEETEDSDPDAEAWEKKLDRTADKAKKLRATFKNVLLILENAVSPELLKRNVFANEDLFDVETPWGATPGKKRSGNEDDALAIKEWLISRYRFEASVTVIEEALNRIAAKNSFHPVKEFLETLEWDGVDRIEGAFSRYLDARMPEPYLTHVCVKFFLAMIARIYQPGVKFDHLPVFEGEQGIGKSSFGQILVGEEWFLDGLPDLADKDAALNLQGIWLCEMSELSSLYRSQLETAKAFIVRQTDKVRPPYGQRRVDFPRSCVFYGTTNQRDYLTDATGNRRFWPVFVKGCDFKSLRRDRLQLLAEAKFLYDHFDEPLYLNGEAARQARVIQASRRIEDESDAMETRFMEWLKLPAGERQIRDIKLVALEDLFDHGPWMGNVQKNHPNRVAAGRILRKAGYRKVHTMSGNRWKAD